MRRNWKLASAALLLAIAVPVTAYAADNLGSSKSPDAKKITAQTTKQAGKLGEKPNPDKDKGINLDPYAIAKAKLGLDDTAFKQAVKAGKSLADIAKEKGIALQPLIDSLTKQITDAIQLKLGSKALTAQEKENVKKKALMEAERIYKTPLNKLQEQEKGKEQGGGAGEYDLQAAFKLLGIDKAKFADQVQAGKSLADIAKEHGVSRQKLIDALVSDINAKIDALKTKGTITAQQASQKKQAVLKEAGDFVDHTQTLFEKKMSLAAAEGKDKGINVDPYAIATTKLGLDKAAFQQAVEEGKSLADIAKAKGIELQPLIDAQAAEIVKAIQQGLDPKTLSAEEQENVKKKAAMEAERIFTAPLNQEEEKEQGGNGYNMQAALELIGIDKATFAEQVQGGKSFADIAKDHGVTRQQLIDALMTDVNAKLAEVQANGDITAEQADQKKKATVKEVEDFIDHTQTMFEMKEKVIQVDHK